MPRKRTKSLRNGQEVVHVFANFASGRDDSLKDESIVTVSVITSVD